MTAILSPHINIKRQLNQDDMVMSSEKVDFISSPNNKKPRYKLNDDFSSNNFFPGSSEGVINNVTNNPFSSSNTNNFNEENLYPEGSNYFNFNQHLKKKSKSALKPPAPFVELDTNSNLSQIRYMYETQLAQERFCIYLLLFINNNYTISWSPTIQISYLHKCISNRTDRENLLAKKNLDIEILSNKINSLIDENKILKKAVNIQENR
jgi:hypothetical protein